MDHETPKYFAEHIKDDQRNFDRQDTRFTTIEATLKRIEDKLTPIANTYDTAGQMWKWVMALAVLLSIISGTVVAIMKISGK